MSGQVYCHRHRVTYAECTIGNHVYYARYLDILEEARGEFLRHAGQACQHWHDAGRIFPVIDAHLRYHAAARYDDVLTIEVRVSQARRVRLGFAYRILGPGDRLLVEAATEHVCTDTADKPQKLPGELVAAIQPYLVPAEGPVAVGGGPAVSTTP